MKKTICYLLALFLLISCEYQVHDNFIEVEKPAEGIEMAYDLNAITNGQAILINKGTSLNYSLSAFGKDIKTVKFTMGNKVWNYDILKPNGSIYIASQEFPSGEYTLTCETFVPSGSGSVVDQLGAEGYVGKMSWPVIIDYGMELPELLSYRKNEEGFFELYWNKPLMSHLKVKSYTVDRKFYLNHFYEYKTIVLKPEETKLVDQQNVGIQAEYDVYINLLYEGKTEINWPVGRLELQNQIKTSIISSNLDIVVLDWHIPYKCYATYQIAEEKPLIVEEEHVTITIPTTQFGSLSLSYQTEIKFSMAAIDNPDEILYSNTIYAGSIGTYIENEWQSEWIYNPLTNMFYSSRFGNHINSYSFDNYELKNTSKDFYYSNGIFSSKASQNVLLSTSEKIYIFDANDLTLQKTIDGNIHRIAGITNENMIVYSNSDYYDRKVFVYNMNAEKIAEIPIDEYNNHVQITSDGKYLLYSDGSRLYSLQLDNYHIISRSVLPLPFEKLSYYSLNPVYPDQMLIPYPDEKKIEIRKCSDYSLIREITSEVRCELRAIDPITGNILISSDLASKVISGKNGDVLFEIPTAPEPSIFLLNNVLISKEGYVLNINDYLQK